jgi:hypothetical protein
MPDLHRTKVGKWLTKLVPHTSRQSGQTKWIGKEQGDSTVMSHAKGKLYAAPNSWSWNLICQALSKMEVELPDIEVQRTEELYTPIFRAITPQT